MAEQHEGEPAVVIERRSGGGGIGIFLLGVAVGAGIALLLAPQSGAETREDLRRGARRLRRKARDVADDARETAEDFARRTRDAARGAAREAREALERRLARHERPADADDAVDDSA